MKTWKIIGAILCLTLSIYLLVWGASKVCRQLSKGLERDAVEFKQVLTDISNKRLAAKKDQMVFAYESGFKSAAVGESANSNPYLLSSDERLAWHKGWIDCKALQRVK